MPLGPSIRSDPRQISRPPHIPDLNLSLRHGETGGTGIRRGGIRLHLHRLGKPTVRAFERTIADLENAEDGAPFGSGMGAISATLLQLVSSGDHIVSGRTVYGCTHSLLKGLVRRMGVAVTFVDSRSINNIRDALQPNTRVSYA